MSQPTLCILLHQTHYFTAHPLLQPFGSSAASGELWMGIKGDAATIPPNTARAFYDTYFIPSTAAAPPEALRGPVWVGGSKSFLAYGADFRGDPRVESSIGQPWFLSTLASSKEFMDMSNPERISADLARKICADLRRALDIVEMLDGRGGVLDGMIDRVYNGSELTTRLGAPAVREEIRNARRVFDERTAAINYGMLHTQLGTSARIDKNYGAYLREWRSQGRLRGALLDMMRFQPSHVHVLDMLEKEVPIYYPMDEMYHAVFTEEELRGLEGVSTKEQFCSWLALKDVRPPLDLSQPDLWPSYRPPLPERLSTRSHNEVAPASRLEQMEKLSKRIETSLGDLMRPSSTLSVVFAEAPSVVIVGDARLLVKPITELRMMVWSITHRPSSLEEILREALLRGWPFSIVYPLNFLETVRVIRDHHVCNHPVEVYQRVPYLDDDFDVQEEWGKMLMVFEDLLRLPHSRAFLYEGGVLWRLALLFGEHCLQEWGSDGFAPSVSVTTFRMGREEHDGYRGDQVSELEAQLLIGTVCHRESGILASWFPSSEMLVRHGYYDGEWSNLAESLIRTRFDSLQRGESTYHPLMELQWEEELSQSSTNKLLRNSAVLPNAEEVDDLLQAARKEMRTSWNASSLSDIERGIGLMVELSRDS